MPVDNRFRHVRLAAFIRWTVSGILNAVYRIRVRGKANIPARGPFLLVANHAHVFDPLVIQKHVRPWIYWVTKKELYKLPLLGALLKKIGTIAFDRDRMDVAALRQIVTIVRAGEVVGIFPQGTRVPPEQRDRVEPKAATAHLARRFGIPVLPVAVANGFRLFGGRRPELIFGQPIDPASLPADDKAAVLELMRRVYALMGQDYFPA